MASQQPEMAIRQESIAACLPYLNLRYAVGVPLTILSIVCFSPSLSVQSATQRLLQVNSGHLHVVRNLR